MPRLAAALLAVLLAGCQSGGVPSPTTRPSFEIPSPPPGAVGVRLTEYELAVDPPQVSAGSVSFQVANIGATKHDFYVLGPTGLQRDVMPSDDEGETVDVLEVGLLGSQRGLQPGDVVVVKLLVQTGHYVLICNLPDHYSAGMRADFDVH